jgi:hypothetical protein
MKTTNQVGEWRRDIADLERRKDKRPSAVLLGMELGAGDTLGCRTRRDRLGPPRRQVLVKSKS